METPTRSFSRRSFLQLSAGTATAALLSACVAPAAPGAPADPAAPARHDLTIWYHFSTAPRRPQLEKVVQDFNELSENYTMEAIFVEFGAYTEKLLPSVVTGQPPDVAFGTGMIDVPPWGMANQVIALDDLLANSSLEFDTFVPYTQVALTYDGKLWGIPFQPDTRFFFMDIDAVEEAGLDPSQPPTTWDELWDFAHALDVGEAPNWERIGFSPTWGNTWPWTMIWTNGGELVDAEGNFTLDTPEAIETGYWYKEWVDYYGLEAMQAFAGGFGPGAQDPFTSGLNPLQVNGVWYPARITEQNPEMRVAYSMIPYNRTPASWGAGHPFVIPVGASSTEGAWRFIEYVMSYDVLLEWMLATGTMVGRMDVMEDPEIMNSLDHWPVAVESIRVTQERPLVPEVPSWYGYVHTAFQEIWDGVKTPEQALGDAQDAAVRELESYRAIHG